LTGPGWRLQFELPANLACAGVKSTDRSPGIVCWQLILAPTRIEGSNFERHLAFEVHGTNFPHGHIDETSLRTVGGAEPNSSAVGVGVKERTVFSCFQPGRKNRAAM